MEHILNWGLTVFSWFFVYSAIIKNEYFDSKFQNGRNGGVGGFLYRWGWLFWIPFAIFFTLLAFGVI